MRDDPLGRAIDLAVQAARGGGGPFGAVIDMHGRLFEATNRVTASHDPTAHAEVMAIRAAAAGLGTHDLSGGVLYTSTYPCPMCFTAAMWARLDRVVYAAMPEDAAAAGFDDRVFWDAVRGVAPLRLERDARPAGVAPFNAWVSNTERVEY